MSFFAAAGICLAALLVAAMVLMSGFGLGTLLTPLFAVFYDIKIAVLLVAISAFLGTLIGKQLLEIVTVGAFRRVVAGSVVAVGIAMAMALV